MNASVYASCGRSRSIVVERSGVRADQDAPVSGPHTVEDDGRGARCRRRGIVLECLDTQRGQVADVFVGCAGHIDPATFDLLPDLGHLLVGEVLGIAAELDHRVACDLRADVAGHHDRGGEVRGVDPEVDDQRLGEAADGELGGAVRGVRADRAEARPETVDAARVDDVAALGSQQHRHERAGAVEHTAPADREDPVPLAGIAGHQAATATDAGVVEQQVDVVGAERRPPRARRTHPSPPDRRRRRRTSSAGNPPVLRRGPAPRSRPCAPG